VRLEKGNQSRVVAEGEWFGYDVFLYASVVARSKLKDQPGATPDLPKAGG